jgi:hypothetical protein
MKQVRKNKMIQHRKKTFFYSTLLLLSTVISSCFYNKEEKENISLITIDLSKNYPLHAITPIQQLGTVER